MTERPHPNINLNALEALYDVPSLRADLWVQEHGIDVHQWRYMHAQGWVNSRKASHVETVEITPLGRQIADYWRMRTFLASIATADPQSEQAGWMVATAKDGLRWGEGGDVSND